jgi:hypothetical protein
MHSMIIPSIKRDVDLRPELRGKADALMEAMIEEFYQKVPSARHLMSGEQLNIEYYKRHTIEIILRLRMKRTCDALAIRYFTKRDPYMAKEWSKYTEDEMLHDAQFFLRDLELIGVSPEEVYSTEPMISTKLLIGYYQYGLEYEESPLALISSVYFVEYTTARTQPGWLDHLEKILGKDKVRGARAHVNLDLKEDHDDFVWRVLASMVNNQEDERRVLDHIRNVGMLYAAFFMELHKLTIEKRNPASFLEQAQLLAG